MGRAESMQTGVVHFQRHHSLSVSVCSVGGNKSLRSNAVSKPFSLRYKAIDTFQQQKH